MDPFLTYRNQRNPPDRRKKNGEKAEYAFCLSFFTCFTASQMRSIYKVDHFPHSFSRCVGTSHPQYGPQVFFRCLSSESDTNENYDTTTLELYTLNALITDFVVYFKISYIAYVQTNINGTYIGLLLFCFHYSLKSISLHIDGIA